MRSKTMLIGVIGVVMGLLRESGVIVAELYRASRDELESRV
jgi:hypothetical protein